MSTLSARMLRKYLLLALCASSAAVCAPIEAQQKPKPIAATLPAKETERPGLVNGALMWRTLNEPGSGGAMVALSISPHEPKRLAISGDMLGIGLSTDGGESWQPTFGFKTWEMADVSWHPRNPNVVWCGSMSGPYKSTDGGVNWVQKRVGMPKENPIGYATPIEVVLFDPRDDRRLLAFGGSSRRWDGPGEEPYGAVWESRDGGESWSRLSFITKDGSTADTNAKGVNITSAQFAPGQPNTLYATADEARFLVSTDGGKTWTTRNNGLPPAGVGRLAVHPTNPQVLWLGVDSYLPEGKKERVPGGVYKSTDGGQSWKNSSTGLGQRVDGDNANTTSRYFAVAVSPVNPNVLFANDAAWSTGVIYKSTDGGASWTAVASKGNAGHDDAGKAKVFQIETATAAGLGLGRLVFGIKDADAAYGFNSEFIVKTTDGGRTWHDATAQKVGNGWRGRGYAGWVATNFLFNPYQANHAVLQAMDMGRAWISRDGLKSWKYTLTEPWPWGGGRDASITRNNRLYVTTGQHGSYQGIARSDDGGEKWQIFHGDKAGLPAAGAGGTESGGVYALPDEPDRVWAVVGRKLMKSSDGARTWAPVEINDKVEWITADPRKPSRFFVSGDKNVYETTDGATFTPIGGPHRAGKMTVDSLGRLYIAAEEAGRAGLWRWDGKAWARLWDEYRVHDVAVDPRDPQRIAVATNQNPYTESSGASGVYISSDGGASWSQQNQGLAMLRGYTIKFNPHDSEQIVFGTNGRGFFHTRWPRTFKPVGTRRFVQSDEDVRYAQIDTSVIQKPDATNLARNPSMTGGADTPEGWDDKFGDVVAVRDTQTFKSAPAALRVEAVAGKEGAAFQVLEGTGGKTLRVSGFFKTAGTGGAQVMAQSFDGGWTKNEFKQIKYLQGEFDWQPFEATIAVPDWAARTHIGILAKDGARGYLDDVKITSAQDTSTSGAAGGVAVTKVITDFGNFNYTYGPDWKLNENVKGGEVGGAGFVQIDTTEHGGAGLVLNGSDIAPQKQTHLAIRARRMAGNKATALAANLNRADADGGGKGVTFDLSKLSETEWTTLTVPLPEGNWSKVQQVQLQGTNWGAGAQPLKIQIDSIGTTSVDEKANAAALAAAASDPTKEPPAKDKPNVAGHGFWAGFPAAWMQTFRGQLDRASRGKAGAEKINVLFIGDSLTQAWGDDNAGKAVWQKNYAPRGAENFGIGGDTTRQELYRLQNGLVDGLTPKVVVLRIGTNNLYADHNAGTDEEIAQGIAEIVKVLRAKLPNAKILLLDVLPRENEYFSNRAKAINTLIAKLDDGQNVRFLAMSDAFQSEPGKVRPELYTADQLHLSAKGYEKWAELMQPLFDQMAK